MSEGVVINVGYRSTVTWATLDACDFDRVSQHRWYVRNADGRVLYAQAIVDGERVLMHRLILMARDGDIVDHANCNGLDNRRRNLRLCSFSENARNQRLRSDSSTGLKGVTLSRGRYQAAIRVNGVRKHLGAFETAEEAHSAYCRAAVQFHGEFARFA